MYEVLPGGASKPPLALRTRKYPFTSMTVGEFFFVPNRTKNTLMSHASAMGRKLRRKFSTRLCWMAHRNGIWHSANEGDPGAVQGIAIHRTE